MEYKIGEIFKLNGDWYSVSSKVMQKRTKNE